MFYRYEAIWRNPFFAFFSGDWEGIFTYFDNEEEKLFDSLHTPAWYGKNPPNTPSRAWFTEYGFAKYRERMVLCINSLLSKHIYDDFSVRLIATPSLSDIVMRGKVQCVQRVEKKEYSKLPPNGSWLEIYDSLTAESTVYKNVG